MSDKIIKTKKITQKKERPQEVTKKEASKKPDSDSIELKKSQAQKTPRRKATARKWSLVSLFSSIKTLNKKTSRKKTRSKKRTQTSIKVRALRIILPAFAFGTLAILVITQASLFTTPQTLPTFDEPRTEIQDMTYEGTNPKGDNFKIESESIVSDTETENAFILSFPIITMRISDGSKIVGTSIDGYYNEADQILLMRGNVVIVQDDKNRIESESIDILINEGTFFNDQSVTGSGDFGVLFAQSFYSPNTGKVIKLGGPARVVIAKQTPTP